METVLKELGKYHVDVYLIGQGREDPEPIPEAEHGHFYQHSEYMIDIKGEKHRYIIQWYGTNVPTAQ